MRGVRILILATHLLTQDAETQGLSREGGVKEVKEVQLSMAELIYRGQLAIQETQHLLKETDEVCVACRHTIENSKQLFQKKQH